MTWNLKENNREKHLFKSYYCSDCKQVKPCQLLDHSECCACAYQKEQERAEEYSDYQQVYQQKVKEQKVHYKQLELLKNYQGCKDCKSKEVDAYELYENNRLVCQPCLARKTGGSSSPISFLGQSKWYKRYWGINLVEWLENFSCLPVNVECAREWLKDRNHLNNCQCLEQKVQELVEMFSNSLKKCQEKLKECSCKTSEKVRVSSDNYAWCERCETSIEVASKKRIIKNRNDPRFWGLEVEEKVLCGNCLESKKAKMPPLRKAEFNRYRKARRL